MDKFGVLRLGTDFLAMKPKTRLIKEKKNRLQISPSFQKWSDANFQKAILVYDKFHGNALRSDNGRKL